MYTCSVCGKKVLVSHDVLLRSCDHINATVIANLSATATGKSTLKDVANAEKVHV